MLKIELPSRFAPFHSILYFKRLNRSIALLIMNTIKIVELLKNIVYYFKSLV